MLIGCITGPDFETAKRQIEIANSYCDGVELRLDLLSCEIDALRALIQGTVIVTGTQTNASWDAKVIRTYHNFEETPENLDDVLAAMPPADVYKIATMAQTTTDALRMLCFVKQHQNVAGMCMGPLGQITRILAPIVGSTLTFASLENPASPDQIEARELVNTYCFHRHSPRTKIYGLIGNPISQSPSHRTHNAYFEQETIDAVYVKFFLEEKELPSFFNYAKELNIQGLSVTMPFKEKVLEYVDKLDDDGIGVVNTLTFEDGCIHGTNTDAQGALETIEAHMNVKGAQCVILGDGGAAKAIAHILKASGAHVQFCSRRLHNLNQIPAYDLLINTIPHPEPISLQYLQPRKVVMDICLNHTHSPLMLRAKALGCRLIYGQEMFERQALGQFNQWFKPARRLSS